MLDRIVRQVERRATGKAIFASLISYVVLSALLNRASQILEQKTSGIVVPDLHFAISEAEVHRIFELYGGDGRRLYSYTILIVDTAYPLAYACFLGLSLVYLSRLLFSAQHSARYLCFLPILGTVADYSENIGLLTMGFTFPERWPVLGKITLICNSLKWICVGGSAFILVIFLLLLLVRRLLRARETQ